ncbi:MAG: DUF763 domain-containing protein [Candidatus Nanoarchaeia archaeon]
MVNLPLHGGSCPRWLFPRMKKMAGVISELIINEYGKNEFLRRLSDPYFFQSLGCVIGFDFHSSGLTTTTCGALKESLNKKDIGLRICGGKGATSRKTLSEIENSELSTSKIDKLKYASKAVAKSDSGLIQDGYGLYQHSFVFTDEGKWAVIQQGMNERYARRYHWLSNNISSFSEHMNPVCGQRMEDRVLNLASVKSRDNKKASLDLVKDNPEHLKKYIRNNIRKPRESQSTLNNFRPIEEFSFTGQHTIAEMNKVNYETLKKACEIQPSNFEELMMLKGVGGRVIRSLSLISEIVYGNEASWRDPIKYSFAHGGKDNIPYPVDKKLMDDNVRFLKGAVSNAELGYIEKRKALEKLKSFFCMKIKKK